MSIFQKFYGDKLRLHNIMQLKEETKLQETDITDRLYKDYKRFKDGIFENLVKNNPQYDKLTLFKKSQKLLDRFLFIFFSEDCGLIPPNAISKIVEQWKQLQELDEYKTLYSRFQKLFSHLDKGHKYTNWGEIPAYNGGLFRHDEILDHPDLKIDDKVLKDDSLKLSAYDFSTEVDVNILGHIFEHSLNEIEEMEQALTLTKSETLSKLKTSKRKKDGIFYTPKYITQYIVENTIGTLCNEKKDELKISNLLIDDNYSTLSKFKTMTKLNKKGKQLFDTLNDYKKWLLTLKILDPACGSGAFLNQALDFLIVEHQQIDDLIAELTGEKLRIHDTDKTILENNIYGVDINEEGVEIAKLSLWLRTAQKGRELSDLSGNIKCGNSLIDDPEVAGDKAFDWNIEFKKIMENGGFDVVIGNPPYVRADTENENFVKQRKWLDNSSDYETLYEKWDLMIPFYERTIKLLKLNGIHGFIVSNSVTTSKYAFRLQDWILTHKNLLSISYFENIEVFKRVGVVPIITIIKNQQADLNYKKIIHKNSFGNKTLIQQHFKNHSEVSPINVFKKYYREFNVNIQSIRLRDICYMSVGMVINADEKITKGEFSKDDLISFEKTEINTKPFVEGKDLKRYKLKQIKFLEWDTNRVPSKLRRPTFPELYKGDKILRGRVTGGVFDNTGIVCNDGIIVFKLFKDLKGLDKRNIDISVKKNNEKSRSELEIISQKFDLKYLLSIINSKFAYSFLNNSRRHRLKNYFYPDDFRKLPIPEISKENQRPFIKKADQILSLNKKLQSKSEKFIKRVEANLEIKKLTTKLQSFYSFDFKTFISELKKQKIKLRFKEQDEWEEYFDSYKKEINNLQHQINQTDTKIDKMVYDLYELTAEEIEIVENATT